MKMTCTIEKVLSDARMLVNRLREHESQTDDLISQGQTLHKRVDAMKQYQEDLNELNEVARHRPRSSLIINLLQENTQIRELQQENKELRLALEEHQSALEMIMRKYRQQVYKLVLASKLDQEALKGQNAPPQDMQEKIDKICEMAAVMKRAILVDDEAVAREQQLVTQLKLENNSLRQLLHIASSNLAAVPCADAQVQTEGDSDVEDASMDDIIDTMFDLDSSMISVKQMDIAPQEMDPAEDPETPTQDNNNEDDSINSDTNSIDSQKLIESSSPAKRDSENNQAVTPEKTDEEKTTANE